MIRKIHTDARRFRCSEIAIHQLDDRRIRGFYLLAVDLHSAGGRGVQLRDDAQQSAFAAAGAA